MAKGKECQGGALLSPAAPTFISHMLKTRSTTLEGRAQPEEGASASIALAPSHFITQRFPHDLAAWVRHHREVGWLVREPETLDWLCLRRAAQKPY